MNARLHIFAGLGSTLLMAGAAQAALLSADDVNFSKEGIGTSGDLTLPVVTAILAADYSLDDRISFAISGGASVIAATDLSAFMTCNNGITVGYINRVANTLNFRVTQIENTNNLGATCTLGGIQVSKSTLAVGTKVMGTYAARTSAGEVIDRGCADAADLDPLTPEFPRACTSEEVPNEVTLANVRSQFTAKVNPDGQPFNGMIDVEEFREVFVDGDRDTLDVLFRNEGDLVDAVEDISGTLVVTGDFTWAGGLDGKCDTLDANHGLVESDEGYPAAFAEDCKSFSVAYKFPAFNNGLDTTIEDRIILTVPGVDSGQKLSPQVFTGEFTFACAKGCLRLMTPFQAGRWTINGAVVFVPYMPYGDNISQIVYLANRGRQVGNITIDAFDETGASYSFDAGRIAGGTVRQLSGVIREGLVAAGFKAPGKVAFEITVAVPDKDIDVYSAYNVGGADRGTVVNSQNGRALD
jgi:hypothetical protein